MSTFLKVTNQYLKKGDTASALNYLLKHAEGFPEINNDLIIVANQLKAYTSASIRGTSLPETLSVSMNNIIVSLQSIATQLDQLDHDTSTKNAGNSLSDKAKGTKARLLISLTIMVGGTIAISISINAIGGILFLLLAMIVFRMYDSW